MTALERALADRATALDGLRDAQARIATLEVQLERSMGQTAQALRLARQALADRLYAECVR
jgi:hypothetical protein